MMIGAEGLHVPCPEGTAQCSALFCCFLSVLFHNASMKRIADVESVSRTLRPGWLINSRLRVQT